jgi:hypothetical protein
VSPRQEDHIRIAVGGRCLDDVRIRQARTDVPGSLSYLSFPAHRHRASVEPDHLVVSTQAATVVQLFAEGILVPIGGPAVRVQIGGKEFGPCVLDSVETDGASPFDTTIILRFQRAGGP